MMPLSGEFKELVVARAREDPEFRCELIVEAVNMILAGEITPGRLMLRDYINATGSMAVLSEAEFPTINAKNRAT